MQYVKVPKSICNDMERIQRRFIWGDSKHSRKVHLVGWDVCCLPKKEGGPGLKNPHLMNEAFLLKMLWKMVCNPRDIWCRVLYGKYGRDHDLKISIEKQNSDSPLWKALTSIWPRFHDNLVRKVGDGRTVRFWLDKWVPNEPSLMLKATNPNLMLDTTFLVRDMVTDSGRWNCQFLVNNVPSSIIEKIMAIPPPMDDDGEDLVGWAGTNNGIFSVRSAYSLLAVEHSKNSSDWLCVWKWKGPYRVQMFMWIVMHGRLLTNERRSRWNVFISLFCPCCNAESETIIHVLRDCPFDTQVWLRLLPSNLVVQIFSHSVRDWIFSNIKDSILDFFSIKWSTIFMMTCWYLWNWGNKTIFEDGFHRPINPLMPILKYAQEVHNNQMVRDSRPSTWVD